MADVERFTRLLGRGGRPFLDRWFRPAEVRAILARREPARHTAALFAAKEAVIKALRVPDIGPVRWREIEISDGPDGGVSVVLHGSILELATATGLARLHVTTSHGGRLATATAVAVAASPRCAAAN